MNPPKKLETQFDLVGFDRSDYEWARKAFLEDFDYAWALVHPRCRGEVSSSDRKEVTVTLDPSTRIAPLKGTAVVLSWEEEL